MTLFHSDESLAIYQGDWVEVLRALPAESVHCVVTSPPYWGLRDYGVPGQLGLEPTPDAYLAKMVEGFREVRRVLRKDGTLWLNLGDSYRSVAQPMGDWSKEGQRLPADQRTRYGAAESIFGLKPKDLVGIPWRVAFALQADGWYLRSDIIWAKPNPMPESVTDRPTKAHEYVFLLTRSPRYYYDAEAVREAHQQPERSGTIENRKMAKGTDGHDSTFGGWNYGERIYNPSGRNLRSVWSIATEPYPGAHFATFPQKLVEPCIKAGTSERGVCPECGAPWVRLVERKPTGYDGSKYGERAVAATGGAKDGGTAASTLGSSNGKLTADHETVGWRPSCGCIEANGVQDGTPVPATVLDPFAGSGTTGLVANRLGRRAILIDLSTDYLDQALSRNQQKPLGLTA